MTQLKLSMAAFTAAMLLAQPAAAAGSQPQGQGQGKPECPGAPGATPTEVGTLPTGQGAGAPATIAPAFDDCGVGAFPQAEDAGQGAQGKGKATGQN